MLYSAAPAGIEQDSGLCESYTFRIQQALLPNYLINVYGCGTPP